MFVDSKLYFASHIEEICKRLRTLCGIVAKLRYFLPRRQLILYENSNVNPIIQYGILVYGCCYSSYLLIYLWKKKIFHFRKRVDPCEDILHKNSILSVYDMDIYELLKFIPGV